MKGSTMKSQFEPVAQSHETTPALNAGRSAQLSPACRFSLLGVGMNASWLRTACDIGPDAMSSNESRTPLSALLLATPDAQPAEGIQGATPAIKTSAGNVGAQSNQLIAVTGSAATSDGQRVGGMVIAFTMVGVDCGRCDIYTATSASDGTYHLTLPVGTYSADCGTPNLAFQVLTGTSTGLVTTDLSLDPEISMLVAPAVPTD
jgi:hypothetical protein